MVSSMHSVETLKCDGVLLYGVRVLNEIACFHNAVHILFYRIGSMIIFRWKRVYR